MIEPQFRISRSERRKPIVGEYIADSQLEEDVGGYKPRTALWTSTFTPNDEYPCGWVAWCASEMPGWIKGEMFILYPIKTARVYVIDGVQDVKVLKQRYPGKMAEKYEKLGMSVSYGWADVNWKEVSKDYDGVQLTESGQWATRFPVDRSMSLYGWDCESVAWFRYVFEYVERYKKRIVVKEKKDE